MNLLRQPLFRLLLTNLAFGVLAAVLLVGGMLALNSQGLRRLKRRDMDENVLAALIGRDESKSPMRNPSYDCSRRHRRRLRCGVSRLAAISP
jgi:hypothetical protein